MNEQVEELVLEMRDDGGVYRKNEEWPTHIVVTAELLRLSDPKYLASDGEKFVFVLANGTGHYRNCGYDRSLDAWNLELDEGTYK